MYNSKKPILITARDALWLSGIALTVYFVIIIIFYMVGIVYTPYEIGTGAIKAFVYSFICQFAYEYTGYNAMIAESSIRYAKRSTLEKYTSRREALLHKIYYNVLLRENRQNDDEIKHRMVILSYAITNPNVLAKFIERIKKKKPQKIDESNILNNIPDNIIVLLPTIVNEMDENIIEDILQNGFDGYISDKKTLIESLLTINNKVTHS